MTNRGSDPPIELLLARPERHAQALSMNPAVVARAPSPERRPPHADRVARLDGANPNDLSLQVWGVIAPAGERGDRLLDLIRPLIAIRTRQQGRSVPIYRVPQPADPDMSLTAAYAWTRDVFVPRHASPQDEPLYQLVLGDLHEVPVAIQRAQAARGLVGRLAFDRDDEYRAYAEKIMSTAALTHDCADAVLCAVRDGTAATELGAEGLVAPIAKLLRDRAGVGGSCRGVVEPPDLRATSALWDAATGDAPAVMLWVSHGQGPPATGWRTASQQRRFQGSLCLDADVRVTGADLSARAFLPGGVWLMTSCYGAGTPASSAYYPWLRTLRDAGAHTRDIEYVLASLPIAGAPPFISAVTKAALANPDGPLAVVGHIDLAWSFSFQDLHVHQRGRHRRLGDAMLAILAGARVGVAIGVLSGYAHEIQSELLSRYQQRATSDADDHDADRRHGDAADLAALGRLWMLYQDLAGYMLLGDPAVRLSLAPNRDDARDDVRDDARDDARDATGPTDDLLDAIELGIGQLLSRTSSVHRAARNLRAFGIDSTQLGELVAVYSAAGRAALRRALADTAGSRADANADDTATDADVSAP